MKGILITIAIMEYILLILGNQYFGLTTFILLNLSFGLVALGLILKNETFRFLSIVFFSFSAIVDSIVLLNSKEFVLVTMSLFFALCGEIIAILINDKKKNIHKEEIQFHEKTKSLEKELPDDEIKDVIYIKSDKSEKESNTSNKEKSSSKKTQNNRTTKSARMKTSNNKTTKSISKKTPNNKTTKSARKKISNNRTTKSISKKIPNNRTTKSISKKRSKSKKKTTKSVNKQDSRNIGIKKIHNSRNKTKSKNRKIFGSVHSNLFHYTGCKVGARVLEKNKIFFKSDASAWNKHYHKHKCKIATYKY